MIEATVDIKINAGINTLETYARKNLVYEKTAQQDILEDAEMENLVDSIEKIFVLLPMKTMKIMKKATISKYMSWKYNLRTLR